MAGMDRLLRVINHHDFRASDIAKELLSAAKVTQVLGSIALGTAVKVVDIARPSNPWPMWMAFIPGADAFKLLYGNPNAAGEFYLSPEKKTRMHFDKELQKEVEIRVYGEIRWGTWWNDAQEAVTAREEAMDRPEGITAPTVYVGPLIWHYDKTHLDALGNYVLAPVYMSTGNYTREFMGRWREGYILVALLPVPKADAFAKGWTRDTPAYRNNVRYYVTQGMVEMYESLRLAGFEGLDCRDPSGEMRKVYPLPFIFSSDLGEQYQIAGLVAGHCASRAVPKSEIGDLKTIRSHPIRTAATLAAERTTMAGMPSAEANKHATACGVYPHLKCFLEGSAFEDETWGNIMLVFLGPDELHTIYGGLFGVHFYQILRTCAPRGGQTELLVQLDRAVAYAASTDKPGWLRLPSNRTHFSTPHNLSYREKGGVLQILACVLADLCRFEGEGGDVLVEWVNALNRWLRITLWNKEPDDVSLAESDRLLWKFQEASERIAHLRKNKKKEVISTGWNLPKMGQMGLFVPATIRNGHPDFSNTDRGEQAHELPKGWFQIIGARPGELVRQMANAWQRDLAVSRLKATSFFRGPVLVQGRASADQLAYDTGRNTLNITSRLMPTYRDFELLNKPSTKRLSKTWRSFRAWMSYRPPWTPSIEPVVLNADETPITEPLGFFFRELPEQIGFFILRDVKGWDVHRVAAYARRVRKKEASWPHAHDYRVYVSHSVYIAPTAENERSNTHSARATPSFSKRPVFNDVVVNTSFRGAGAAKAGGGQGGGGGSGPVWCGKLLMLFRIRLRKNDAGLVEAEGPSRSEFVSLPCAFVRWYEPLPKLSDASGCPYYRWEARSTQARVSVVFATTIREVVQMLPVPKDQNPPGFLGTQLYKRNTWLRKLTL